MSNFVSIETQYTPLDVPELKNTLENKNIFKRLAHNSTLFLVISLIAFVGSIGYAISKDSIRSTTQADEPAKKISTVTTTINPVTIAIKDYPTEYKDLPISKTLYEDIKTHYAVKTSGQKNFVIDKIVRFYIYADVLNEEKIDYAESNEEGEFAIVLEDIATMEDTILAELVSEAGPYESLDKLVSERLKYFK